MTLTHYGWREWGGATVLALLLLSGATCLYRIGLTVLPTLLVCIAVLLWIGVAGFFRSPRRRMPSDETLILSPADGTVKDIEVVDFDQAPFTGKALRVGIFLSVFNVHVNRAPAKWKIESKLYRKGRYLDARDEKCIKENEAMTIAGEAEVAGVVFPMGVRQISGAIARRIVCPVEPGRSLERGKIYGMIKFGSRTELYLPVDDNFTVQVKIGDKVRAGITPLAKLTVKES